jgi:hypothetical protein
MKKAYLAGLLALLLVSCLLPLPQPLPTTPQVTGPVTVFVLPSSPSATPAVCTDLPEGVELIVTPLTALQVRVEVRGMLPGEQLRFQFIRHPSPNGGFQIEHWNFREGVKADGLFTVTQGGLDPAPGSTVNAWTVKVIHARGVACQEITLPMS